MSYPLPIFDHLTLNARDELGPCVAALESMGFLLTPPSYSNIGAVNQCVVLGDAYLEAIAINPEAATPRRELMLQPLGLNALVFRTEDADACYADLLARGLPALPVQPFSRRAKNSLGEDREVSFRVVRFEPNWGAETFTFGRIYFCQHLNPEVVFDPGFARHGNGSRAFSGISVEVKELDQLSLTMKRLFGDAWEGDTSQARLRTQAFDIQFVRSTHDRIGPCAFKEIGGSTGRASAVDAVSQSKPVIEPPQVFDSRYGRFSFGV